MDLKIFTRRSSLQRFMKIGRYQEGGGGGVDSIFGSADSLPVKLNQVTPVKLDF